MTSTCFPLGLGVPTTIAPSTVPDWSGAPLWWDITSGDMPFMNNRLDDPRWVGARRITSPGSGSGAGGEHMAFRALHGPDPAAIVAGECLFLSWNVKVDGSLDRLNDYVVVGFYNPATLPKKAIVAKIVPYISAAPPAGTPDVASVDFAVRYYEGSESGGTWTWTSPAAPAWLDPTSGGKTRVWADSITNRWAVEMFLGLSDVGLATPFSFFYHVQVALPGGTTNGHQWPTLPHIPSTPANFPNPDMDWGTLQFGGAGDSACAAGISLAQSDIGTATTPPGVYLSNTISFKNNWWTVPPASWPTNQFHAKPWNRSGSPIPDKGIAARFRLANWGSLPDWDDPSLKDQLWTDIRGGGNVESSGTLADSTQGDITFDWQLENIPGELPDFAPQAGGTPAKQGHQCMLVELSAGSGAAGSLNFVNDSVYTNMEVIGASAFERDAEISVKTLGSLGGTHRDVYVYVETLNMPKNTTTKDEAARRERAQALRSERLQYISKELPPVQSDLAGRTHVEMQGTPEWIVPTNEDVEAEWPIYRVHVWNDTGETVTEDDGTTRKLLRAQTSFGYLVNHSGDLYGWDHQLSGAGLQEIAPHFYRLSVPNEGTATIKTSIVALEKPRSKGGCLGFLLLFLNWIKKLFS